MGELIGGYAVVRKLGEGGMGTVWLARSRGGRLIAVKVARPELAGDPSFRERFRAEVAAVRTVGGFHTAPVVDADPEAPEPWLATAYVPGPTLSQLLAEQGPMDEGRLRALGTALAEALQAIHRCGVVHRDLKPGNIIMAEDGPRVLDFGIARAVERTRLTVTGTAFGTPGFLAPEQAEGLEVGPPADVFALGAVLVAAAGGSAFGGGTPVALMYRSVHAEPDLSAVPEALRPVVAACLEKAPDRRPATGQLLDWLSPQEAGAPEPQARAAAPTSYTLQPPAVAREHPGPQPAPPQPVPQASVPPQPGVASVAPQPAPLPSVPPSVPQASVPPSSVPPQSGAASVPPPPAYAPSMPSPYAPGSPYATPPAAPVYGPPYAGPPVGEPEFLAMDRKNAVVVDAGGISLGTDGQVAAFAWDRIDVAWCQPVPGRRPTLAAVVSLTDGSVHSCEVGTRRPDELQGWLYAFTAVVAHYRPQAQGAQ